MNIVLTGNPFVDTGLGVIAALAGLLEDCYQREVTKGGN
jgi:hypothetical protein